MFERIDYIVDTLEGDYAYLKKIHNPDEEAKCVARALLPEDIEIGSGVVYEMLQYRIDPTLFN